MTPRAMSRRSISGSRYSTIRVPRTITDFVRSRSATHSWASRRMGLKRARRAGFILATTDCVSAMRSARWRANTRGGE